MNTATAASGQTATPYLSINNVEVIYNHVILVLKGVSLEVGQGSKGPRNVGGRDQHDALGGCKQRASHRSFHDDLSRR